MRDFASACPHRIVTARRHREIRASGNAESPFNRGAADSDDPGCIVGYTEAIANL